jgi:hypothetical protein
MSELDDVAGVVGASVLAAEGVLNAPAGRRGRGGESVSL